MAWLGGLGRGNEKKRGGKWGRPEAEDGSCTGSRIAHCVGSEVWYQGNGEALPGCPDPTHWHPGMAGSKVIVGLGK